MKKLNNPHTSDPLSVSEGAAGEQLSIAALPDLAALYSIRLRQSELADLFGVTRACVNGWLKRGWITADAIGRIDPAKAVRQLLSRTDASKVRAKFLASAFEEVNDARRIASQARIELGQAREANLALHAELETLRQRAADAEALAEQMSARLFELEGAGSD